MNAVVSEVYRASITFSRREGNALQPHAHERGSRVVSKHLLMVRGSAPASRGYCCY